MCELRETKTKLNILAELLGYEWSKDNNNEPILIPRGTTIGKDIFLDDKRIIDEYNANDFAINLNKAKEVK